MFPACAGMNRRLPSWTGATPHVPRVRGDEPGLPNHATATPSMFPACAGMNQSPQGGAPPPAHVPRVRGDEPFMIKL